MKSLVNAFHPDDYYDIREGVSIAKDAISKIQPTCPIVVPHEHRYWEYGTGIQMLLDQYKENVPQAEILDVGSGWSGFGPALNYRFNMRVTEYEPDAQYRVDRQRTNDMLQKAGRKGLTVYAYSLQTMPEQEFDAVFCLSVLEHVPKDIEKKCWRELTKRVRRGGLLLITCDVVEVNGKHYMYDEMRAQPNYTMSDMQSRVEMLIDTCGMIALGIPNYTWNGPHVFDYNFFRAGFLRG